MYCEHCGLEFHPRAPVCTFCGKSPPYEWIQFSSLMVIFLAVMSNTLAVWFLLPRVISAHPSRLLFRAWLWVDHEAALYAWMPLAAGLLAWELYALRKTGKAKPVTRVRGWLSRKMLAFVLAAGFAPILPWWIPAGQPSEKTMALLTQYPGMPSGISWGAILIVCAVLCCRAETRNLLLGRGRALSLVSLGALALLLALILVGWSLT